MLFAVIFSVLCVGALADTRTVTWSTTSNGALRVNPGDTIQFTSLGIHHIKQFADKTHFTNCDFGGVLADLTAHPSFDVPSTPSVQYWFGCDLPGHCQGGLKLEVTVTAGFPGGAPDISGCWQATCAPNGDGGSHAAVPSVTVTLSSTPAQYNVEFFEHFSIDSFSTACDMLILHEQGTVTVVGPNPTTTDGFNLTRVTTTLEVTPLTTDAVNSIMNSVCKCGLTWTVGTAQIVPATCITGGACALKTNLTQYSMSVIPDFSHWSYGSDSSDSMTGWTTPGANPIVLTPMTCSSGGGGSSSAATLMIDTFVAVLLMAFACAWQL